MLKREWLYNNIRNLKEMAQNNELLLLEYDRMVEYHGLSYAQLKERILSHSKEDFSCEVVTRRINMVRKEMRYTNHVSTLTPSEYLTPFTI